MYFSPFADSSGRTAVQQRQRAFTVMITIRKAVFRMTTACVRYLRSGQKVVRNHAENMMSLDRQVSASQHQRYYCSTSAIIDCGWGHITTVLLFSVGDVWIKGQHIRS